MKKLQHIIIVVKSLQIGAKFLIAVLVFATSVFVYTALAAPPGSSYSPGETLAPTCSPGDTNCTITTPAISGANSDITSLSGLTTVTVATTINFDSDTLVIDGVNNRVGIGTSTPNVLFQVAGDVDITGDLHMGGVITHDSPIQILDGLDFLDSSGVSSYHIDIDELGEHPEPEMPNALHGSIGFQMFANTNTNDLSVVFWDAINNRPQFILSKGGSQRSSIFDRSLQIGKALGAATVDSNYTKFEGFSYIDGDTTSTGADLGVEDDIEAKGSIYTLENFLAEGDLRLADLDASNYVGFQAPATVTSNVIWILPDADGTTNQVLKTDGSGALSWTDASTGDLLSTNNLSDLANASTARTNLGLVIGTNVQAYDADLDDLADGTLSKTKVQDSTTWDTAYTHSQDNTQAHSDYLLNNASDTITANDPGIIFDESTASDTDYWLANNADQGGDDNDLFQIGKGTTIGTTPYFTIDKDGNIGIGDDSPDFTLDVAGTFGTDGNVTLGDASGDTVTSNADVWTFASDTAVILSGGVDGLNFASDTLSIDATNGRVGIGTATPAYGLQIFDTSQAVLSLETGGSGDGTWAIVADAGVELTAGLNEVRSFTSFDSKIFAGTGGSSGDAEIYSSPDGTTWTQVAYAGDGDINSGLYDILSLTTFNSKIYAGTGGASSGAEIYESSNGTTWTQVASFSGPEQILSLGTFGGKIYAGTGYIDAAEIHESSDGTTWTKVASSGAGLDGGLYRVYSFVTFGSKIYTVAAGGNNSAKIYSSPDGTTWTKVAYAGDGEISADLDRLETLAVFGSKIYAGGGGTGDAEIYESSDGTTWTLVALDDIDFNIGGNASSITTLRSFNEKLYAGTNNYGEIYESSDGTTWTESSYSGNYIYSIFDFNGDIYAGDGSGAEIYQLGPTDAVATFVLSDTGKLTISSTGGVQIGNSSFYYDARSNRYGVNTTSPDYVLDVSGTFSSTKETILARESGNVGIRDTDPSTLLSFGGTGSTSGITFGDDAADSVNIYRSAANILKTDDAFEALTFNALTLTSAADGFTVAGGTTPRIITVTGSDITLTGGGNTLTLAGSSILNQDLQTSDSPTFAGIGIGSGSITMTGSLGATGARLTKGWFTDLQVTNAIVGAVTGNAATVTTNANLTGPITSVGNATSIAAQTGTGTTFVVNTSPTLVTPVLGAATGTSLDLGGTTLFASRAITVDTGGVLNIVLASAAGDDFTIDTNKLVVEGDTGNVGIGDASPAALFTVGSGDLFQVSSTGIITNTVSISGTTSDNLIKSTLTNSSSSGTQNIAVLDNAPSTGTTESILVIDNSDTNTAVTNAIQFINAGGGFTNLFNNAGTLISSSEFNVLDSGIALSELVDSGTLTAGTVDINGGTIDGTTIGASSASSGTFTTLSSIGVTAIGNNSATVAIDSSDWNISTTGAITGVSFDANGTGNSIFNVDLTADITGILPIANGGTNKALTLSAGGIPYFDTDSFEVLSAGTSGQVLTSGGTSAPTWTTQGSGGTLDADTLDSIDSLSFLRSDTSDAYTSGTLTINDDLDLAFGSTQDWTVQYDEGVDDQLIFATTNTAAITTTDPLVEFLVGTTPTADQQVFGIAKGTQASNTALFTVDEDGDVDVAGALTLGTALAVAEGGTGATTLNDLITLTTHTTGNYVATITDAGNSTITITNGTAEGGAVTLDAVDLNCTDCLNATEISDIYLFNTTDAFTSGTLTFNDSTTLALGTGTDFTLTHNGTNTVLISATGNLLIDNINATGASIFQLGTDTNATAFQVLNNTGTNLFEVDGSGNIGIGTASPNQILHIKAGASNALHYAAQLQNDDATDGGGTAVGVLFATGTDDTFGKGGLVYERFGSWGRGSFHFLQETDGNSSIPDLADAVFTIQNDGDVGIGTTGPMRPLHLYRTDNDSVLQVEAAGVNWGEAGFQLTTTADTNGWYIYMDDSTLDDLGEADRLGFWFSGVTRMTLDGSSGNVGIGTTSPSGILHTDSDQPVVRFYDSALTDGQVSTLRLGRDDANNEAFGIEYKQDVTASLVSMHFFGDTFGDSLVLKKGGNVGIGDTNPSYALTVDWNGDGTNVAYVNNSNAWTSGSADYAEYYYTVDTNLKPGETVCVDVERANAVKRCTRVADGNLMGIVSASPAFLGNAPAEERREDNPHYVIVGMLGQIPAKVTNENGAIRPGDSLTSATRPGYIMKANAGDPTVGVALESSSAEIDTIKVLISRKNKSVTVAQVEEEITARIANMEIEDEVNILISNAIDNLNLDDEITGIVDRQLLVVNARLTLAIDEINGRITIANTRTDDLAFALATLEGNVKNIQTSLDDLQIEQTEIASILAFMNVDQIGNAVLAGDITANAFIIPASEEDKRDIIYLTDEDNTAILDQIKNTNSATYYSSGDEENLLPGLGLIAETSPLKILSPDGTGIDVYKMATFLLAGVKALAKDVFDQQQQINALTVTAGVNDFVETQEQSGTMSFYNYHDPVFTGHVTFSGDSVGRATVVAGTDKIEVKFEQSYTVPPVITLTLATDIDLDRYVVLDTTVEGFIIKISPMADDIDIEFNWHAFGIDEEPEDNQLLDDFETPPPAPSPLNNSSGSEPEGSNEANIGDESSGEEASGPESLKARRESSEDLGEEENDESAEGASEDTSESSNEAGGDSEGDDESGDDSDFGEDSGEGSGFGETSDGSEGSESGGEPNEDPNDGE